jgi:hypothetical protein
VLKHQGAALFAAFRAYRSIHRAAGKIGRAGFCPSGVSGDLLGGMLAYCYASSLGYLR